MYVLPWDNAHFFTSFFPQTYNIFTDEKTYNKFIHEVTLTSY